MLSHYKELKEFLPGLHSDEIDEMLLSIPEDRRVYVIFEKLKTFECVTKELQKDKTSISDVRIIFDALIDQFQSTANRLGSNATIVHCKDFESGVVKLQRGNAITLSREEKRAVAPLLLDSTERECDDLDELTIVERALKRQKTLHHDASNRYIDTRFLLATSNVCERLFSTIGHVLNDRRSGLTPANLESRIFLKSNCDL